VATRVKAYADGQWVRDAALAQTDRQRVREMKETA